MATESSDRPQIMRFGIFEADLGSRELRKGGIRIKLYGQPFEVLAVLLERPGEAVPREELRRRLWSSDTFVDFDAGLNTAINRLREALGDSAENPRFIETVPRRGYRFIAPVKSGGSQASVAEATASNSSPSEVADEASTRQPMSIHGTRLKLLPLALAVAVVLLVAAFSLPGVRQRLFGRSRSSRLESLAVLPLVNLSGDPEQDFFADGMTEALITDLGKISALRVISRTSVVQYKGTKKPLPEIARELNVDGLVEGTVLRSGNHLRITANLLQASPEKHLWGETYESAVGDVLALQGQVAQAIAREIQVKLTPEEQNLLTNARPVDPQAHDDYLRGRYLCDKDTREGVDRGIQYFEQAIHEAPSDPLGYAGLANCYVILSWGGGIFAGDLSPAEIMPEARDAAAEALRLDENLAEAHTSMACAEMILNWNWPRAEREFKRAIELNPSYSSAHAWYAHYLVARGRFDESAVEAKRALELDPFSVFTMDFAEWAFYIGRHYDLAIKQSRKSSELAPDFPWAHYDLGQIYEWTGRTREAIEEYNKAQQLFGLREERLAQLQAAYQHSGEKGYWRKTLDFCLEASTRFRNSTTATGYGWCDSAKFVDIGVLQVHSGEIDAAFRSLETSYANHEAPIIYINIHPGWDPVRSDPRFQNVVGRIGLKD